MTANKAYSQKYSIADKIGDALLTLPASHRLPWTLRRYPINCRNLVRINDYLREFRKDRYNIVDIGANIGDTAFLLRETDKENRIICIEGNNEYLPLLEENVKKLSGITIARTFVGQDKEQRFGELVSDGRGTTFVKESDKGNEINYTALEEIIRTSGVEGPIGLLKIDTDGFDCQIIKGNFDVIRKYKPALFFEYAPPWFPGGKDSQADIFDFLQQRDYTGFIFYDAAGNYIISCNDDSWKKISSEMHFYLSYNRSGFGDIAVFHKDDASLFNFCVDREKLFFSKYYSG